MIPVPENMHVDSITTSTVNLSWSLAKGMDHVPHNFEVSYQTVSWNPFTELDTIYTSCGSAAIKDLKPLTEYHIYICTIVENVGKSQKANFGILTGKRQIDSKKSNSLITKQMVAYSQSGSSHCTSSYAVVNQLTVIM